MPPIFYEECRRTSNLVETALDKSNQGEEIYGLKVKVTGNKNEIFAYILVESGSIFIKPVQI